MFLKVLGQFFLDLDTDKVGQVTMFWYFITCFVLKHDLYWFEKFISIKLRFSIWFEKKAQDDLGLYKVTKDSFLF